ncbi:unnamed protein product [Effrenium voratum]|nr:unnamed protein product [Effrenium voratum]
MWILTPLTPRSSAQTCDHRIPPIAPRLVAMATLLNTMHGSAEPTTWAPEGAALPAIKGATSVRSPSRRPSTASVRSDGNGSQAPEMLMKQAEQWRQLYHDSEATCAQVKGERTAMHDQLSEALDRERQWAAESLELRCKTEELEEVQNALNEQLTNGRLLLQNKEESLCMLRCQLEAKEEELEKGRREQRQSQDLCRRLEDTLAQMAEQERQAAEQHEAELSKLNSELQQQKDLTSQAVQEVRDLTAESEQLQQKLQEAEVARQRMEEEIAHLRQPLEEIEKQWAEKLANSEQQLKAKKEAVAALQAELLEKDEEVERLRRTSRRASLSEQQSEVEKEELAKKLDTVAKRAASKEHDCDMKDSELWRLKTELKTERELCQSALQEVLNTAAELLPYRLTDFQRDWCTHEVLSIYLRGRKGDVSAAADILASTLLWRESHKDLLTGDRTPKWQGDLRVLCQGQDGHPLLYLCSRAQTFSFNASDAVDHVAAVLEAAVQSLPPSVQKVDAVVDCFGFDLRYNLDPRPMIGIAELLRQPYRDRLRSVLLVDAPWMIQPVWRIVQPLLPPVTQQKFRFLTAGEAVEVIQGRQGPHSARVLQHVMRQNRGPRHLKPRQLPSEVDFWQDSGACSRQDVQKVDTSSQPEPGPGRSVRPSWCFCRRRKPKSV